jgi:ABC-type transport system involved in cytochrome bd biosynthesis fused ATPase/permease subunit
LQRYLSILNRFSSDVGTIDDALPNTLYDFLATFTMVIGGIATAIFVLPPVLLSLPLLLILFLRSRKVFVCSSQEIKRLEGLSRSPIFDSIAESLNGVATIRANDAVPYFRAKFEDAQNAHSRAFFAFIYTSRYLGVRIDCLMFIVIFISCYLAIILKETGKYSWMVIFLMLLSYFSTLVRVVDLFHIDSVTNTIPTYQDSSSHNIHYYGDNCVKKIVR